MRDSSSLIIIYICVCFYMSKCLKRSMRTENDSVRLIICWFQRAILTSEEQEDFEVGDSACCSSSVHCDRVEPYLRINMLLFDQIHMTDGLLTSFVTNSFPVFLVLRNQISMLLMFYEKSNEP